ncbi:MAG: hypothetical protein C6W56_10245 [Caldibacillus debilis]|nr:MAG: hypothetical protein C6W56_10245 [Caldibacillus debilis]
MPWKLPGLEARGAFFVGPARVRCRGTASERHKILSGLAADSASSIGTCIRKTQSFIRIS